MTARRRLPNRRRATTFDLMSRDLFYTCTVGYAADGTVLEIFLSNSKSNSASDANARDSAITASLALQFGCPMQTLQRALLRDAQGRPQTPLGAAIDQIVAEGEP
jgi:hypothetical protein